MGEADAGRPRFTKRMRMHLNGGAKFSELHYEVYRDGRPTGITHVRKTDGSPQYRITEDLLLCGDEHFDLLATGGLGHEDWLLAHSREADRGAGGDDGRPR